MLSAQVAYKKLRSSSRLIRGLFQVSLFEAPFLQAGIAGSGLTGQCSICGHPPSTQ
ncbi:hypothetical protein Slin14017_G099520 [Septoria linicola]|nr:hypothetical protein Slin14017_G099520 [Septoria linicola]